MIRHVLSPAVCLALCAPLPVAAADGELRTEGRAEVRAEARAEASADTQTASRAESLAEAAARVAALLTELHARGQFDGVALVADETGVVYEGAFGTADRGWGAPMTADTRFPIASITKQFTAAAILQLVEARKLELDGPLSRYLPEVPDEVGRLTLHQLLNHSSGLPIGYQALEEFDRTQLFRPHTTERLLELHAELRPAFEPGEGHSYSNYAYTLLAAVVERLDGRPFAEALKKRIFDRAGMNATLAPALPDIVARLAPGYALLLDGFVQTQPIDLSIVRGAACHLSTARDLYRWDRLLHDESFLSLDSRASMFNPSSESYGYAWVRQSLALSGGGTLDVVRHDGIWPGAMTVIVRVPDHQVAAIVLSNRNDVDVNEIAELLLHARYGRPVEIPPRPGLARVTRKLIEDGIEAAAAEHRLLAADPEWEPPSARRLNQQGYLLLRLHRVAQALDVFRLNVALDPENGNLHDSLGEGLLEAGQLEQAQASYRRALELDPDNDNARAMLKTIAKRKRAAG